METQMTFKEAMKRYRIDAGKHFVRPVRKTSHLTRGAWYLLDKRGNVVAIVNSPDNSLWGARLAYFFNELGRGNAA